jgi:hypothetical protein
MCRVVDTVLIDQESASDMRISWRKRNSICRMLMGQQLRDVQTPRRLPSTFDENETGTEPNFQTR